MTSASANPAPADQAGDRTDRYAVFGHPIAHSLSPLIHTLFAGATEQSLAYNAIDILPEDLESRLDELTDEGLAGANVTMPHKQRIMALCDTVSPRARLAGAVNTLIRRGEHWHGDTTDGQGLMTDLVDHLNVDIANQHILMVGAGGSAWSVLGPLLEAGPASIVVANRTLASGQRLADNFSELGDVTACGLDRVPTRDFGLVINATSATLQNARPSIPQGCVRDATCYDLMYASDGTAFGDWCRRYGARSVHTGIGMLVEQAALSFEMWRGVRPETGPVRKHLADELGFRS